MTGQRSTWDRLAAVYDLQAPLERAALRTLVDLLDVGRDERLLDVGTGTGQLLRVLAARPVRPRVAVGLDSSAAMLARAAATPLPPGWRLERGDAERLALADRSFDLVTAAYVLHLLDPPSRARVVAECRRVLRPGGRLGVVTVAPPRTGSGAILSAPVHRLAGRSAGPLAGLRPLDPRPELAAAGFEVLESRRVHLGYHSLCVIAGLGSGERRR